MTLKLKYSLPLAIMALVATAYFASRSTPEVPPPRVQSVARAVQAKSAVEAMEAHMLKHHPLIVVTSMSCKDQAGTKALVLCRAEGVDDVVVAVCKAGGNGTDASCE